MSRRHVVTIRLAAVGFLLSWLGGPGARAAGAQMTPCSGNLPTFIQGVSSASCSAFSASNASCPQGCGGQNASAPQNCQAPVVSGPAFSLALQSDGTYTATWTFDVKAPWNQWGASNDPGGVLETFWYTTATAPATSCTGVASSCPAYAASDEAQVSYQQKGLTCQGAPYQFGPFSLRAQTCNGPCGCTPFCVQPCSPLPDWTDQNNLVFIVTPAMLHCPEPPKESCCDNLSCKECKQSGEGAASVGGGGSCVAPPQGGPGALLRYRSGGVGKSGFPGTTPGWTQALGRFWSHDHAERIVQANATEGIAHVWLLTRSATFREFTNLTPASGTGLRLYQTNSPSDEHRRLSYDPTSGGWQLQDLDGTVTYFLASGLWDRTVGRNPANVTQGHYTGSQLSSVSFPDGRSETYAYDSGGRLAGITEAGVDGTTRSWTYTWRNDDLALIGRPDGTGWEMFYDGSGNLLQMNLVGTDGSRRVAAAFQYDSNGNVVTAWHGDPSPTGPNVADPLSFVYDSPQLPGRVDITDAFGKVATFLLDHDTVSLKPKVTQVTGDCPSCGLSASSTFEYKDAANPLLPTAIVDGRGLRTEMSYNADGQMTKRSEAVGTPLVRDTTWQYHPSFRGFPTLISQPSTAGGAGASGSPSLRQTTFTYSSQGDLLTRTIQGAEAGSAFTLSAVSTFNAGGQPLTVDPPGYGTADVTSMTYDASRGSGFLVPASRIDPLIGTTSFGHDGFNRRTAVTDVNGVTTMTTFDALNRVTSETRLGDTAHAIADLVMTYQYGPLGDLFRSFHGTASSPAGDLTEYTYDPAGHLVSIEHRPDTVNHGERTFYTLDAVGHRTREELQHWNGSTWVDDSKTDFVFSTRCHLDKQIAHTGGAGVAVTEFAYDCDDNLVQVWDPNHPSQSQTQPATQTYAFDALNRLLSITQPWAGAGGGTSVTSFGYDVQNHLSQVTDPNGNLTTYTTSDRDLLTRQVSPVTGTTSHAYNEHGQEVTTIDTRNIVTSRTLDPLDRVTVVTYPDSGLNVTYSYDAPGAFALGRLTGITRHGETIGYGYDRFGRLIQDGVLGYGYDVRDNRTSITYPDGAVASYTFDSANREQSLAVQVGPVASAPVQPVASAATYLPFGPLASVILGNGLGETRTYDPRYTPSTIQVGPAGQVGGGSPLLSWSFATDPVGNIAAITDQLNAANSRSFAYLDINYFLTQGNGPWGSRAWSYDKIGNRLTESRGSATDLYSYVTSSSATTAKLAAIALASGGSRSYSYDAAGNTLETVDPTQQLDFLYDAAGSLSSIQSLPNRTTTDLSYDGRRFLRRAQADSATCSPLLTVPTYSSEGLLLERTHRNLLTPAAPALDDDAILYFAGRPIADLRLTPTSTTLTYLSTDHLGTPILATTATGIVQWQGGFEPFGTDWNGAQAAGEFLRLPGQWEDETWAIANPQASLDYDLNRWQWAPTGRYTQADPLESSSTLEFSVFDAGSPRPGINTYAYVDNHPTLLSDPTGLGGRTIICDQRCWIRIERDSHKGLHANWGCAGKGKGCVRQDGTPCENSDPPPAEIKRCLTKNDRRFIFFWLECLERETIAERWEREIRQWLCDACSSCCQPPQLRPTIPWTPPFPIPAVP